MKRKYRPVVTVLKEKKGVPTKLHVSGHEYSLVVSNNGRARESNGRNKGSN